jgi:hypothetical protein
MQVISVIHGRLTGPTTVELDEPAPRHASEAEVWLRINSPASSASSDDVFSFLRALPPGALTKSQLDDRIRAERDEWEDR